MTSLAPDVIAVTGGTGFTGAHVLRDIRRQYPDVAVRCLVRPTSARGLLDELRMTAVEGDLDDGASLDRLLAGADTLINVASLGFPWVDSLFAAIGRASLRRGVFVSTTAILTTLPVRSKPMREHGERLARASGVAWTILRPTMIYGTPDDRNVIRLIRLVDRVPVIPLVAPTAMQQPVHVADVARAVVDAVRAEATVGQAYNIAGGEPISLRGMVEEVARALGRRRVVVPLPFGPVRAAVQLYNAVSSTARVRVEQVERIREHKAFSYAAAAAAFGYAPRSFRDGVATEVAIYRQRESTR